MRLRIYNRNGIFAIKFGKFENSLLVDVKEFKYNFTKHGGFKLKFVAREITEDYDFKEYNLIEI